MSSTGIKHPGQRVLVYTLLALGSFVFCWPLVWMLFTSIKAEHEMFTRKIHFFAEAPIAQVKSPYVDTNPFPDMPNDPKQGQRMQWLEEAIQPQVASLASDLDAKRTLKELTRGAYLRLQDSQPAAFWTQDDSALKAAMLAATDKGVLQGLLANQVRRSIMIGQLRARSYDVQDDQLVAPDKVATSWKLEGSGTGSLVQGAQGGELQYDFKDGDKLRLIGHFKTSFPVERLYRLQLSLRADKSWNVVRATVEKNGRQLESVRDLPMADANWSILSWQEPGPDELTNKIRTWVQLKQVGEGAFEKDPHSVTLVVELEKSSALGAWSEKIKRNYQMVFDNMPFWRYVSTSLFLVALNLFGTLFSCSVVAYAFARLSWPGRNISYALMLATMMVPAQVTMIPFFLIIKYLDWYNTLLPLWVCSFFANAFNVFLLHQFFKGIPKDLEDAARIDGCGPIRSYWYIMLPLVKPSLVTVAVFTFMGVWNDFMGPLIYLSDQRLYPLSLGLYALNVQSGGTMSMMMAGSLLMILPVVVIFFFAQRYFIQGITMTGMKG